MFSHIAFDYFYSMRDSNGKNIHNNFILIAHALIRRVQSYKYKNLEIKFSMISALPNPRIDVKIVRKKEGC